MQKCGLHAHLAQFRGGEAGREQRGDERTRGCAGEALDVRHHPLFLKRADRAWVDGALCAATLKDEVFVRIIW